MNKLIATAKNYISDPETNIFKNYIDAMLGMVVLLVFPLLSAVSLFSILDNVNLYNYVFPLASICVAGAYDTYGRYTPNSSRNLKLGFRLIIDVMVVLLSLIALATQSKALVILAPLLLMLPGVMIVEECYNRVKTAVMISKWYAN